MAHKAGLCLLSGFVVLVAACGGGGGGKGGGGNQTTTPTVTVRPAKPSITVVDSLQVDVAVTGNSSTVTGTVVWTSGTYTSSAATLSGGSATVTIPAGSLAAGSNTIKVSYTPDSASSSVYTSASGTATVTVNLLTPTVTVTPSAANINTLQALSVTVTVAGASGSAIPTGTIALTSGSISQSGTLNGGTVTISVAPALLPPGNDALTATFAPDTTAGKTYGNASGNSTVSVTRVTPTVTVTPASNSIGISQALSVNVMVSGPASGPGPTGSVILSSGSYSSSAATLSSSGAATISIPAGKLATGIAPLSASYTPDTAGNLVYGNASGSTRVTVTTQITPTVTVSPALASLSISQSLNVTVRVTASGTTPTGSLVLSSGSYASSGTTLSSGSAIFSIPAWTLVSGSDTLSAAYTPDTAGAGAFNPATGSATVSVARATPTVTVTPASLSINSTQTLNVTVAVRGPGTGAPVPTGTINLSGPGYASASPLTLSGGSASITLAAGALTAGSDTLNASYSPDETSSPVYNSTTGASAAITVVTLSTVSVTQGVSIGTVTDQLMGMNLAAWYDVAGNAGSIIPAFAKAGIKAIRWPGGSWSDAYHWGQGGTAPTKCKTSPTDTTWAGVDTFPQFMTAITKAGNYDLALTANYGSNAACTGGGEPAEAAAWAAEAVAEGYPPSHMTVGNEEYGSWEFDLHTAKNDPVTYGDSLTGSTGYYTLIKAASPTTKVGVVLDAGSIQPGWDTTVLSRAKGSYDFVEFHWYPANPGQEDDTYLVHTAAQDLSKALLILKEEMTAAKVLGLPIYVGEMGSVSSDPGKQSWSITQGLYAGQTLGEMMNAGVARATWWIGFGNCNESSTGTALGNMSSSLYGWQTFGAYNVFSDGPTDGPCGIGSGPIGTMSPTARAFQLFSNIAESGSASAEEVLSAKVTGDATNIRAYAATNNGGTALFLFNLNENFSQPVTVMLSSTTSSSDVKVITYDKSIYDQTNAATPVWAAPTTKDMGAQNLPLTLTLTPWSMNVVIIK